jgi:hypothetical protein
MNTLNELDPSDRDVLLATSTDRLLGMIIKLNRCARYHNMIDAIGLVSRLMELRARAFTNQQGRQWSR